MGVLEPATRFLFAAGSAAADRVESSLAFSKAQTASDTEFSESVRRGNGGRVLSCAELFFDFLLAGEVGKGSSRFGGSIWLRCWLSPTGAVDGRGW